MLKKTQVIPIVTGIGVGILLILLMPWQFEKYTIREKFRHEAFKGASYDFGDMNGDEREDLIACGVPEYRGFGMRCECCKAEEVGASRKSGKITLEQANVDRLVDSKNHSFNADADHDGTNELYIASVRNDSLFICIFKGPLYDRPKQQIFIDTILPFRDKYMLGFGKLGQYDVNGDGTDEIYFYLSNGYPIYPRKAYRINLENEEVISSPSSAAGFGIGWKDTKIGNYNCFTAGNTIAGNYEDNMTMAYPDYRGYTYALDSNLNLWFEPIPVVNYPGRITNLVAQGVLYSLHKANLSDSTSVTQYDPFNGDSIRSVRLKGRYECIERCNTEKGEVLRILHRGAVTDFDSTLSIINQKKHSEDVIMYKAYDLNNDGRKEYVGIDINSREFLVLDHELKDWTYSDQQYERVKKLKFYQRQLESDVELVVRSDKSLAYYDYSYNSLYWLRWPTYASLVFLSVLGSTFTFRSFRRNVEQKYKQQRELNKLQLLSLKNQVDPHFTLNALNTIDWMYRSSREKDASRFMGMLSRLMHRTVTNSDKVATTLHEEMEFCRNYCELHAYRLENFDFVVDIEYGIDSSKVGLPRQLVFIFVENAVKHGLGALFEKQKFLEVKAVSGSEGIKVTVTDNGLGFTKSSPYAGTGRGLKIAHQMKDLYNRMMAAEVNIYYPEVKYGTRVEIVIPQ